MFPVSPISVPSKSERRKLPGSARSTVDVNGMRSNFAPRLHTLMIPRDKIRDVIGPGGKTIRAIVEETGCEVEVENDGKVIIASPDGAAAKRAIQMIERLTEVPQIGRVMGLAAGSTTNLLINAPGADGARVAARS